MLSGSMTAETMARIRPSIKETPLVYSEYYSQLTGANIRLKCEWLQYSNSFKARGAMSFISALDEEQRTKPIITISGGNHGMGVCYAASRYGMKATVYVPATTPQFKKDKIRALGGIVEEFSEPYHIISPRLQQYADDIGAHYIHPFDDDAVILGQSTLGYEILQQKIDTDMIICSIGGGGLIGGISLYAAYASPQTRIYGVQTQGADAMSQSLIAGELIALDRITSCAESLGATKVSQKTYDLCKNYVQNVYTVSDEQALAEMKHLFVHHMIAVEPAASCCLAALISGQIPVTAGSQIVVVLCGANIGTERFLKRIS